MWREQTSDRVAVWYDQSREGWVTHQVRLDAMLAVFSQAAIEAAAPTTGERVLDVGCGAGGSSLALAARVGAQGQVLGVDISSRAGQPYPMSPHEIPAPQTVLTRHGRSFDQAPR